MNILTSSTPYAKTNTPKKSRVFSPQGILLTLLSLILLCVIADGGIGFYFSNVLLEPTHQTSFTLEATNVSTHTITLPHNLDTEQPGTFGLTWPNGQAIVGGITSETQDTVTRELIETTAPLTEHTMVAWNREIYLGKLKDKLNLETSTVQVPAPLGSMPAIYVPGKLDTWVIMVHGRGDAANSGLRFFPPLVKLGFPVLSISYRNDTDAPASPDGSYHLGDSEWQDLEAGVKYALSHGARHLVLYGWSMGGSIIEMFQHHSSYASNVQALILDAPVLDWRTTLTFQANNRSLPSIVASTAEFIATLRTGINFDHLNQLNQPQGETPILLFHGTSDTSTPISVSDTFAKTHANIVTYYRVENTNHVQSWNTDPQKYEAELSAYLIKVLHLG
ncbi:alpha/beta hydrolase family protein [Ktedonospora formicarum]|uniref:Peptidase S9 prolyl oligopeptidase catalytic domain-containing protein n=1 Tax=Ktedonospora formicarum TaxID=2778364 RepID=A0A8J3I0D5_9CHLR|nr:alpha/beta fold hydrolase [Ktedonospora formicarum]GHO46491.1 hypothetical protein KSX_46540 [Ktedonospora formicarum]